MIFGGPNNFSVSGLLLFGCLGNYLPPTNQLPKSECRNAPLKPKLALEVEKWLNRTS